MAFHSAASGGPPGPVQVVLPCGRTQNRAYLTLQVRNRHANGTPPLANTQVQVAVGLQQHTLDTDGNGLVTFTYDARADFANQAITVTLTDATRAWRGQGNTGNPVADIHQVPVTVSGQFQLTVELYAVKPGTGDVAWQHAWTANLALTCGTTPPGGAAGNANVPFQANANDPAEDEIQNHALDCASAHVLSVGFFGALDTSTVSLWTENNPRVVGDADAAHDDVTYRKAPGNGIRLVVTRRGAAVKVRFTFRFPQVMVVGEGTSFEYARGLACKYGDALHNPRGFRWVVATQYDVTAINTISNNVRIRNWETGAWINHANLRALVNASLAKNLINHGARFDATVALHWAGALAAYGAFDAVVFNNPHPGYGMHMCEVLGLTDAPPHRNKNGRAISVYSFGYGGALDAAGINPFVSAVHPRRFSTQRDFVRGNALGQLDHQNTEVQAIAFQYDPAHTTLRAGLTVKDAFQYYNGDAIDADWYGTAGEMGPAPAGPNRTDHYRSNVNTLGLQGWLLRSYRFHGPSALKAGGWLFVHGSNAWNGALTGAFSYFDGAANRAVGAMTNLAAWPAHGAYFVHYRTNFTSERRHPSWYSVHAWAPQEPNINNARVYGLQKP